MAVVIERNNLCPCGSSLKYKRCCGKSTIKGEEVNSSIHELGHLAVLAPDIHAHVSYSNPCVLCEGSEGKESSLAHTGYPKGVDLPYLDEIIYSLAGGAAEVASGLSPQLTKSELGMLPTSMGDDIENVKKAIPSEIFEALNPATVYFERIAQHFEHHADALWRYSRAFREKRVLTPADIDLSVFEREKLFAEFREIFKLNE
jgi:SEC-C motif-containing protein